MKFKYAPFDVDPSPAAPARTIVHRPVVRVRFTGPNGSRKIWALLDTGADESYITESLAEKLGIVPISNEATTINSASGEMLAWYGKVSLEITGGKELYRTEIIVGVVGGEWPEMILGHLGFFEHFDAHFSDTDLTVTLTNRIG